MSKRKAKDSDYLVENHGFYLKKSKRIINTLPSNFTKTEFGSRHPVRKTSCLRTVITDVNYLMKTDVHKWKKAALGEVMSFLTTTHSLEADDREMDSIIDKFDAWVLSKKDILAALDPSYVFVNWGNVKPTPIAEWNLSQDFAGANAPVPVPNFPNCYVVNNREDSFMLVGIINSKFPDVRAFRWDTGVPIKSHIR